MMRNRFILLAALIAHTQCVNSNMEDEKHSDNRHDSSVLRDDNQEFIDPSNFKLQELTLITAESIDKSSLVKVDSSFHCRILTQIDGYNLACNESNENYFVSIQKNIFEYKCLIISLYYGVCYDGVFLLLIDKNDNLINYFPVTEFHSSCDMATETTTEFISDRKFKMTQRTIEPGNKNYITELEFIGVINQQGGIDTLDIVLNKEYEE